MGRLGFVETQITEALVKLTNDKNMIVRSNAAIALGNLGNADSRVIDVLINLLNDKTERVRDSAAAALGILGKVETRIIESLLNSFRSKDDGAVITFRRLRTDPSVVSALLNAISNEDELVRSGAAFALDVNSNISFDGEEVPTIAPYHLPILKNLLSSKIVIDNHISYIDGTENNRNQVKEVAWSLLQFYSEKTGERIYWDGDLENL